MTIVRRLIAAATQLAVVGLAGCATAHSSIAFEVSNDPILGTAKLTCQRATSSECVFWIGDKRQPGHISVHVAAGASAEIPGAASGRAYCSGLSEDRLSWPACTGSPGAGRLNKPTSFDDVYW